jgi:ankyrin repeat protein
MLIQHGANLNIEGELGRTVLHIACFFGFYEITKFLLENAAIVDDACFERASKGWDNNYQTVIIALLKQHLN